MKSMKLLRSTPIVVKAILLAGLLSACQNEQDNALVPKGTTSDQEISDQNARTAVAVGSLVKDGTTALAYNNQNLLRKETYPGFYYELTYAPQLITATRFQYGMPSTENKYTLDANGRCVQSVTDKTFIYEYNASGQLSICYNKNQPNERREFSYTVDAGGWKKSLGKVTFYDAQGAKTKEVKFSYGATGLVPDKCPLNPDVLPAGISRYLPVFGTFNTNLVKSVIQDTFQPNGQLATSTTHLYSYTLNPAGKATNVTVKKVNGSLVSSTDRSYFVPTYSF